MPLATLSSVCAGPPRCCAPRRTSSRAASATKTMAAITRGRRPLASGGAGEVVEGLSGSAAGAAMGALLTMCPILLRDAPRVTGVLPAGDEARRGDPRERPARLLLQ